jgi:hypothetical protein
MMKVIVLITLCALALAGRDGVNSIPRRYLAFALVGVGAFLWAATFDAVRQMSGGVPSELLYRHVIVWSAVGLLSSLGGLVAVFWCHNRPMKIFTILVGTPSAFMCAVNILVPY